MFEIGNSLREARVRQQLELSEVELATKIRTRYLRALEKERAFTIVVSHDQNHLQTTGIPAWGS